MNLSIASKWAKKTFDVTNTVDGEITYTTELKGASSSLEFTLIKTTAGYGEGDKVSFIIPGLNLAGGNVFYGGSDENIFYGRVFKKSTIKNICYDQLIYLQNSKQSYNFSGKTLSDIIKLIAGEFGLIIGEIACTKHVLPDTLYEDKTLLEIIIDVLDKTNLAEKTVYVFFDDFGKLTLKKAEDMKAKVIISLDSLLMDCTYETSINESYNYIKIVKPKPGGADAFVKLASELVDSWGKLQLYEKVDTKMNDAQIKEKLNVLFDYYAKKKRNLKIKSVGVPGVRAGSMLFLDIQNLGDINLKRMLLVTKCTHRIKSGAHTMDLELEGFNE